MLPAVSNINLGQNNNYKPAFGSVVLSRVLLRTVDKNGDIYYTPIMNNEKGIVGVYQSLSRRVNSGKNLEFLKKLKSVIPDFNPQNPIIHSTLIGVRSSFKRFLLTGADARKARDLGTDLIGALGNKKNYATMMKEEILNRTSKRIFLNEGDELGIDLIVEGNKGKRKLVDIEISTLHDISRAKPPKYASNKKEIKKLENINQASKPADVKKSEETQKEFDFVNGLTEKKVKYTDFQ